MLKKKVTRNIIKKNTEAAVQFSIIKYIKAAYPKALYCASAGGLKTSTTQGKRMKMTGYVKGFPDLFIYESRGGFHGLAIEVKRIGEYPRPEQTEWMNELNKRGYRSYVCQGFDHAKNVIDSYFAL